MSKIKNVLIIQTAFIGDVILTTPVIEELANEFPGVKIDFLTIPKSRNLLESNPNLNNLIITPPDFFILPASQCCQI